MKWNRSRSLTIAGALLAFLAGCTERNNPTDVRDRPALSLDAAATLTSIVTDPVDDLKNKAPAWLDLTSATITRRAGRFFFTWDLAAFVPADPTSDPAIPAHSDYVCVGDGLDTDPTTAPVGYPFGKNEANYAEFYVAMCWTPTGSFGLGTGFNALLIDRRPLLGGGQVVVTPVQLSIQGAHVSIVVDAAALGDPAAFAWVAFTEIAKQADPNDAASFPDLAPDLNLGAPFANWPQQRRDRAQKNDPLMTFQGVAWCGFRCELPLQDSNLGHLIQSAGPRATKTDNLTGSGVPTSIGTLSV